jgi:hypothetical protein
LPNRFPLARPPRDRRSWLTAATALVVASLTVAACGGGGQEDADPATIAPQGSLMFFSAAVRPEGDQREAIDELSRKVLKIPDPGQRIQRELDESFRRDPESRDVTYADDIAPWLGRRAGAAITRLGPGQPEFAIIIASQDNGAAREGIEREAQSSTPRWSERSYKGVDYFYDPENRAGHGVVGDFAVVASEAAFKATVDASEGERGLAAKPAFETAAADNQDKLGFGYIDVKALIAAANASGQLPPGSAAQVQGLLGSGTQPATVSVDAQPDRITFESAARGVRRPVATDTPLVGTLPADSWLALGTPQVGRELRRTFTALGQGAGQAVLSVVRQQLRAQAGLDLDRDLLPALGDLALFARGSNLLTIGGGIVIQTPDPGAAQRVVSRLRGLVSRQGAGMGLRVADTTILGARGFRVGSSQIPGSVNVVAGRGRMVIAYGDAATSAALVPQSRLADAPAYQAARESIGGRSPQLFMQFGPVAQLMGISSDPDLQRVRTYLNALETLAAGSRVEGDTQTGRMVITVK